MEKHAEGFREGDYPAFFEVITRADQIIDQHQFEGASVGAFNANIIARKLGLADKKILQGDKEQPLFPDQNPEENH